MLLIAARYYELPQCNNNLKSLDSDIVPVQVRLAADQQNFRAELFHEEFGFVFFKKDHSKQIKKY